MDEHENKAHDENKEILQSPNERTYGEVTAENEYLGRRVLELLTANAELEQKIQSNADKREITEPAIQQENNEEEVTTTALRGEIVELKKKVTDQEETIDYLVQERDEASDEVYKLKLKLADAWNVELSDDADKVREVARLVSLNQRPKS